MKEVHNTEIAAIQYYENAVSIKQKDYVKLQCHCVLCNTQLELKYEKRDCFEIKELASCPQCQIRTRTKAYPLN